MWLVAGLALAGCTDDSTGGLDRGLLDIDGALSDRGPGTAWDSGLDGQVHRVDLFVIDAGPPSACLNDDGALFEQRRSDLLAGATDLRTDVDLDADGAAEIAVLAVDDTGARFIFLDAADLTEQSRIEIRGASGATLMPNVWPPQALTTPMDLSGTPAFAVLEHRADGDGVRVVGTDGTGLRFLPLPRGAADVTLMNTGSAGWRVLVNEAEGGCAVLSLEAEAPLAEWASCRLKPAWDVNSDDAIDVVRRTDTEVVVLDVQSLEPALQGRSPYHLGFMPVSTVPGAPAPGAFDLRGEGAELVGALVDGGLQVVALDPFDLLPQSDPISLNGRYSRLRYVPSPDGLRLWAEEDRNGLRYLRVLAPGLSLGRRAELGPFRELQWGPGADVDGDGYPEVWMLAGSDASGTNTAVRYLSPEDGAEAFVVPAERSARFSVAWTSSAQGPTTFDLDGCEGDERVAVRVGNGRVDGPTPTRLLVLNPDGQPSHRGDAVETWVHRAAVADLDADGRAEVVELIAKAEAGAQVVIWSTTPAE